MTSVKIDAEITDWTDTTPVEVSVPDLTLYQAVQHAIAYNYSDFTSSGTWAISSAGDPLGLTYSNTVDGATAIVSRRPAIVNDVARLLGALYRAGGIQKLTFQGTDYTWNPNGTLKGSNWEDATGNTLVNAIATAFGTTIPSSVTVTTDKGNIKVVLDIH